MTPTTQPVEPSAEARKAAEECFDCVAAKLDESKDRASGRCTIEAFAEIIDSSFAELRRERDELRLAARELLSVAASLYGIHHGKKAEGGVFARAKKLLATTPDAGRGK